MGAWINMSEPVSVPLTTGETLIYAFHNDFALLIFLGIFFCVLMYISFHAGVYIAYKAVNIINDT